MLSILLAIYYTGKSLSRRVSLSTLLILLTALLSLSTTSYMLISETNSNEEINISTRLELKTESPSQDAIEFVSIETEIDNRTAYDQNLKVETKVDEISEAQLNTLRSMLIEELEANNRRNFLPTIINNLFFCLLGMIVPPLSKNYKRVVKFLETAFFDQ